MTNKNHYSDENKLSRQELVDFVATLSESDLKTHMPVDWTVSAVLAHLAFWDFRAITLIKKWQAEGINPSPNDVDVVNESTRPFFIAIEPHRAAKITLDYALALDDLIDSLDPAFIQAIEKNGKTVHLDRASHRRMHIREIKTSLSTK
jgi:hypothetical protein